MQTLNLQGEKSNGTFSHLEHLWEEASADLLAGEVIQAGQAGHGAAQGPVRGRPDPVGPVDAVHGRLCLPLRLDPLRLHLHPGRRWEEDVGSVRSYNPARLLFTFPMSTTRPQRRGWETLSLGRGGGGCRSCGQAVSQIPEQPV